VRENVIRHVAVFSWKPDSPQGELAKWADGLRALPGQVPALRSLTVGSDLVRGERSWDAAVVADVDDVEGLRTFLQHPAHQALTQISAPHVEQLVVVDFDI
jgi:hypothetical protein